MLHTPRPGRYEGFEPAGEGGMGVVYLALDNDLNRRVAFKVVRAGGRSASGETPGSPDELDVPADGTPAAAAFATRKARFLQEAWVTAAIEHPGVVPVYEVGETAAGVPYYTMRFVRGARTLADAIAEVAGDDTEMDARLRLLGPFLAVCDTIRYAHSQGVVHRDLKPENVALGEFGEVVVLDWGLAKMRDAPEDADEVWRTRLEEYRQAKDLQTLTSALGTPGYMAPEAALGRAGDVDERSDVYSLGVLLFEILTGQLPFAFGSYAGLVRQLTRETPPAAGEVDESVPEGLSAICARALARDRDARTASVDALAGAIREWRERSEAEQNRNALAARARALIRAARGASDEAFGRRLDLAMSLANEALRHDPGHEQARKVLARARSMRSGARERSEETLRRRVYSSAWIASLATSALAVLLLGGLATERWLAAGRAHKRADAAVQRLAGQRARADEAESAASLLEGRLLELQRRVRGADPAFYAPDPGFVHVRPASVAMRLAGWEEAAWEVVAAENVRCAFRLWDRPPPDGQGDAQDPEHVRRLLAVVSPTIGPDESLVVRLGRRSGTAEDLLSDLAVVGGPEVVRGALAASSGLGAQAVHRLLLSTVTFDKLGTRSGSSVYGPLVVPPASAPPEADLVTMGLPVPVDTRFVRVNARDAVHLHVWGWRRGAGGLGMVASDFLRDGPTVYVEGTETAWRDLPLPFWVLRLTFEQPD